MIEALEAAAGLGVLAWYGTSLFVGGRLLRAGIRDGNPHARWIGTYLFFGMGVGSVLYSIAMAKTVLAGAPMTPIDRVLVGLQCVSASAANVALLTFTRRVFRRDSRAAQVAAAAIMTMLVVGTVGHGFATRFDGEFASIYGAIFLTAPVLANAWTAVESLRYYRLMRKRVEIGLAEPVAANRFLLWGIGAASAGFLLFLNVLQMQARMLFDMTPGLPVRAASLVLFAVFGLVCASCYLCAFFPPKWYFSRFAATASEA